MCFLKVFEYSWQILLDDSFIAGQVRQLKVIPSPGKWGQVQKANLMMPHLRFQKGIHLVNSQSMLDACMQQ
jgi:hypothetical protein